jgi:hypothetical protein
MKTPNSGTTLVPLHFGHVGLVFWRSEIVRMSSNGFWHFSQKLVARHPRLRFPYLCENARPSNLRMAGCYDANHRDVNR